MMINRAHSLWLLPEPGALTILRRAIRELSEKLGGPLFTPHVTLLSRLNGSPNTLAGLTERLAGEISPFELTVIGPEYSASYSRALVLQLANTEPLDELIRRAKDMFDGQPREPFDIHLSLAYGRIDGDQARAALSAVLPEIPARFRAGAIELVSASSETPVDSWRSLCEFPLRGTRPQHAPPTESA